MLEGGLNDDCETKPGFSCSVDRYWPRRAANASTYTLTPLGSLAGTTNTAALLGINDAGDVVGYSGNNAVLWTSGSTTPAVLAAPPGMFSGAAYSVNDASART